MPIVNDRFDVTWTNSHNLQFLGRTEDKQRFLSSSYLGKYNDTLLAPSFTENKAGKEVNGFFQNMQLFTQCVSMLYTEKSVLRYYVQFSQIRSHII